jgi:hypothetical protein
MIDFGGWYDHCTNTPAMGDEMIIVSAAELEAVTEEARRLRAEMRDLFTPEEMSAIREQHEARLAEAERAREELEWQVRLELARVREAADGAQKLSREVNTVLHRLSSLIGANDDIRPALRRVA